MRMLIFITIEITIINNYGKVIKEKNYKEKIDMFRLPFALSKACRDVK